MRSYFGRAKYFLFALSLSLATSEVSYSLTPGNFCSSTASCIFRGLQHSAVGGAQLSLNVSDQLVVTNIGASGNDGLSVALAGLQRWDVEWLDVNPGGSIPDGAFLLLISSGIVNGVADQAIGSGRVDDIGSLLEFSADYAAIGSTSQTIEVRDGGANGTVVATVTGHTGAAARSLRWPFRGHIGALPGGGIAIDFGWRGFKESIAIPGGPTVLGDYLCIKAESPTVQVRGLSSSSIRMKSIPSMTIISESIIMPALSGIAALILIVSLLLGGGYLLWRRKRGVIAYPS